MIQRLILITLVCFSCSSQIIEQKIEIETKKTLLPLKLMLGYKNDNPINVFLCFPKEIIINNPTKYTLKVDRYKVGLHPKGINYRYYRIFKFKDSLFYENEFSIKPKTKDSFYVYYGYKINLNNKILDTLIKSNSKVQEISKFKIHNIPISKEIKKWAISKINDSIKGQLHFSLHNKEKGFFYKSLDIELFED
ncbi:hypothetical protein ACSTS3_07920 [Aquimarina muelleri]|uniref:hypothetical protein n=1 Tax=Aquimarina muelleri TaxID=279356 RepID=UPI003F689336